MTPTAIKLYSLMSFNTPYVASSLGVLVFGKFRKIDEGAKKYYRSAQGSALAVGRFVSELEKEGLITYRSDYRYNNDDCYYFKVKQTN